MKEPRLRLRVIRVIPWKRETRGWKMRRNAPFRGISKPSPSSSRLPRARRACPRIRRRCQDLRLRVGAAASERKKKRHTEREREREREREKRVAVRDQVSYCWHYQVKYSERCLPPEKSPTRMRESRNPGDMVARSRPVRAFPGGAPRAAAADVTGNIPGTCSQRRTFPRGEPRIEFVLAGRNARGALPRGIRIPMPLTFERVVPPRGRKRERERQTRIKYET